MRPTSVISFLGLVVVGVIIADFLIHPTGTKALGNAIVSETKVATNALLGSTTK